MVPGYRASGAEEEYFNHKLNNVKVCSVHPILHNVKDPTKEKYDHLEEVCLRYEKITWTYVQGNLQASDSWDGDKSS
jgi:type VI secretion system secreted protein Hcp